MAKTLALLCYCLLSILGSTANANVIDDVNHISQGKELKAVYLKDKGYSLEEVRQLPTTQWHSLDSFEREAWTDMVWQYVEINNRSDKTQNVILSLERTFTVPTRLYFFDGNKALTSSLDTYNDNTHINFLYPSFYLELKPGSNHFYFRYLATKANPAVLLFSTQAFAKDSFARITLLVIVLGMVVLMAIYNLVFYIIEREKEYAFYLLYLGSTFALSSELSGFTRFLLQTTHIHFGPNLIALPILFLCLFYLSMFDLRKHQPKVFYQICLIIFLSAAYTLFAVLSSTQVKFSAYSLYLPVMAYACLLGLFALLRESIRGAPQALILLTGMLVLVSGTLISFLALWGILPEFFAYTSLFGFAAEMALFSFALSLKKQDRLLNEIKAKQHSYGQLEKVFYPHQLEQIQQGRILEETMPEGEAEAAVIAFDVAASSQIQDPRVKDFLHNVMKACELEMIANYQAETLSSDAYRVKEMGDGFLCSIGFPFKSVRPDNPNLGAWELCLRFLKAFHQVEKAFAYREPIYCGMGLAVDKIEAYFPSAGARQYDLYGRSIVLATRYESYRKMLFEQIGTKGSVIIVQEAVYNSLPENQQAELTRFDLKTSKYKIRDDFQAESLYYKVFEDSDIQTLLHEKTEYHLS